MTSQKPPRLAPFFVRAWLRGRRPEIEADIAELFARRRQRSGVIYAHVHYWKDALSVVRVRMATVSRTPRFAVLSGVLQDARFSARLIRRQPGLFGAAVAGLAMAAAISTAMFTLVNAQAWRGMGAADPGSLYEVLPDAGGRSASPWRYPEYLGLHRADTTIDTAAYAWYVGSFTDRVVRTRPDPATLPSSWTTAVSGSYFPVLAPTMRLGRALVPADDAPGAPRLIVLSEAYWRIRRGSNPAIVGTVERVGDGTSAPPFTVVGVTDRLFTGPTPGSAPSAGWVTFSGQADALLERRRSIDVATGARLAQLRATLLPTASEREAMKTLEARLAPPGPAFDLVHVIGRTRRGVTVSAAESQLTGAMAGLAQQAGPSADDTPRQAKLGPIDSRGQDPSLRWRIGIVMSLVSVLILMASINVTNLLLSNAVGRRREIATRLALGASRGRIVRQLVVESVMLAAVAGAAGLVLSQWITPMLASMLGWPEALNVSADVRVYVFATSAAIATGMVAGLAPARYGRRGDFMSALKADQAAATRPFRRERLRSLFVAVQAATSLLLVIVTSLCVRSVVSATFSDKGMDIEHLVLADIGLGRGYDEVRRRDYWNEALRRLRLTPGVRAAAMTRSTSFQAQSPLRLLDGRTAQRFYVSGEYFEAIGARLVQGRTFTADEVRLSAPVAVVSTRLAKDFWPDGSPLGQEMSRVWGEPDTSLMSIIRPRPAGTRVVGVVSDVTTVLSQPAAPAIYMPFASEVVDKASAFANGTIIIRTIGDPRLLTRQIDDVIGSVDPEERPTSRLMTESLAQGLEFPRMLAGLASVLGVSALSLAAFGMLSVTAFVVGQRRHEISVRVALGASRTDVVSLLLRDSLKPVFLGLGAGLFLALVATDLIRAVLHGISPRDPLAIAGAALVLLVTAAVSVLVPIRRAAHVDPATILRDAW